MKCMSRTHFITLDKSDYRDALYEIERKNRIEKVNFIKGLPIFSKLSRTYLTKFASNIKTMTCNKDQILYRQGDPVGRVYIIREGEFEISKKLQEKQTDSVNDTSEELRQLLNDPLLNKQQNCFTKPKRKVAKHRLIFVGKGQLLGADDVAIKDNDAFKTTARCVSSSGKLIYIMKDDFLKLHGQSQAWAIL